MLYEDRRQVQQYFLFNGDVSTNNIAALRNFPVRNYPERNNPETHNNPEHIHKSRNPERLTPFPPLSPFPPHLVLASYPDLT